MSGKPTFEGLVNILEKAVKSAIQDEIDIAIDKALEIAFEDAKLAAKSKAGSIATKLFGMVEFQYDRNKLLISVRTEDLK